MNESNPITSIFPLSTSLLTLSEKSPSSSFCLPAQDKLRLLSYEIRVVTSTIFGTFLVFGFFINHLAAYVTYKTKQLNIRSLKLAWILCVTDVFGSALSNAIYIFYLSSLYTETPCWVKRVLNAIAQAFTYSSAYIVVFIGIDRYIRIKYLNDYNLKFTLFKFRIALVAMFIFILIQTFLCVYGPAVYGPGYGALLNLPLNAIGAIVVFTSYVVSIFKLKAYNRVSKKLTSTDRSLITLAQFHLFLLFLCYFPVVIYNCLYILVKFDDTTAAVFTAILFMLASLHSCLNALVFTVRNGKNRNMVKKMWKGLFRKEEEQNVRSVELANQARPERLQSTRKANHFHRNRKNKVGPVDLKPIQENESILKRKVKVHPVAPMDLPTTSKPNTTSARKNIKLFSAEQGIEVHVQMNKVVAEK